MKPADRLSPKTTMRFIDDESRADAAAADKIDIVIAKNTVAVRDCLAVMRI
jgi:hypothetical protein